MSWALSFILLNHTFLPTMQELPWDIVYQIVCEVISRNEAIKRIIPSYNGLADVLTLLKVNRSWRSAALAFMLQTFSIVFPQHNSFASTKFKYWPKYMGKAEEYGYGYIKEISIEARLAALVTGRVLEKIKTMDVFSHNTNGVNSLTLTISGPIEDYWGSSSDYEQNLNAFFEFIGRYKSSISIVCEHISFGKSTEFNDVLFSNILQVVRKASYAKLSIHGLDVPQNFNISSSLSVLDIMWGENYETTASFIHQCSAQLTTLRILYKAFNGMDALVQGNVRYPSLTKLVLTTNLYDSPIMEFYSEGISFPHLQHLELDINYPFVDDTLFRSNSLQDLQLVNHTETLNKIKGFLRYTRLHRLVIASHPHEIRRQSFFNEQVQVVYPHKFINIFQSTLQKIEAKFSYDEKMDIPNYLFPENLKILNIPRTYLTTHKIIVLLKDVQSLSHLCCSFASDIQENYTRSEIEELESNYYPLNTTFWNWKVDDWDINNLTAISRSKIVLAILCPNLSYVSIDDRFPRKFGFEISKQIEVLKLDSYKYRISRQLWRHVNNNMMGTGEFESDNGSDAEPMSGCESAEDISLFA